MSEEDFVTIYDLEIPKPLFNSVQDKLEQIDPSRNYSKKHIGEQVFKLVEYMLDEKFEGMNQDLHAIKREVSELENVLDS